MKLGVAEQDWRCFNTVHTTHQWFQTCGPRTPVVPRRSGNEPASPYTATAQAACGTRIKVQTFIFRPHVQSMKPEEAAPTTSLYKSLQ
jgi:hypothetical protein